ncbi:DEKNAAC104927 [Brettanomyces naardenensis]|uniref:DEKNAAC104927 n=1 Tax=Brettanomyces naardenensis TaxID=13370 RepID=A0A448YRZ4_BRENA|nr:DEKNAAC104927 [Brettanomyces naardenensis]
MTSSDPSIQKSPEGADDSSLGGPISYHGDSDREEGDEILQLHQTVTRSITNDPNSNVLTRLSTLSQALSHLSHAQMQSFNIDPNDFDLKRVLNFMANGSSEQGVKQKKTDVVYEELTVIGKNTAAAVVKDVGSVFLPFMVKLKAKWKHEKQLDLSTMSKTREIIRGVTGYAPIGTMTLVLGRPGSGCSTFLKAIGGETQTYIGVEGDVSYNGIPRNAMLREFKSHLIYVPELDEHFPYLTVEQTLKFAIGCKTPSVRVGNVSRSDYISTIKDLYTVLFGLNHVEKTLVGNDFVRGISGGQRKRVSIAEAMATRGTVYCYDNATRGLDASTALEFVEALRTSTNITQSTALVTAYQASENIYQLFDYVTVLYLGRQIYFGTIDNAVDYFVRMGFAKNPRQTSSEFLTAITDPLERSPLPGFEGKVPQRAEEFENYWRNSPEFATVQQEITALHGSSDPEGTRDTFHEVHNLEKQGWSRSRSMYTVNYFQQLKLCLYRAFYNIVNNRAYTITQLVVAVVQALIVGSLYYKITDTTLGAFSRGGALFFALLYFVIMSLAEIAAFFEYKPILNKQRGYTLYHPSAELISGQLISLPVRFLCIFLFLIVLYFLANLKRQAGAFFLCLLFVNIAVQSVSSIFVLISSICPTLSAANGVAGILMMSMILYSSFMIQRPSMYWWFKWFSYANPALYGFEALITSEFHGRMMPCAPSELVPSGPGYSDVSSSNQICAFVGAALTEEEFPADGNSVFGDIYTKLAFDYTYSHTWRNLGILFGFVFGIMIINGLLVEYYNPMVATSDKLLFVRGGELPEDIAKLTGADENKDDPEKGDLQKESERIGDGSTSSEKVATSSSAPSNDNDLGFSEKLGSDDIFMWQHVNYTVPYQGEDRRLLDDVQGFVLPGTLTALMGESGAGKTTLLNVLSQRVDFGVVTGDFLINGRPLDSSFERRTGYVQQQDIHIAELTVRESLLFAARLRRPSSVPDAEKVEYVEKIMQILHMEEYADAIAGQTGYGLNVEQRKKLSIATELVTKPSLLLFLDEPTSGLDSQSAWAIVQVLKQLAKAGQAILCTIHQPSATLFEEFDRLLLLQRGGQTVYFGDIGKNSGSVLNYFESHGARKCLPRENSAEYILEVIGAGATAVVNEDWHSIWLRSEEFSKVSTEVQNLITSTSQNEHHSAEELDELKTKFATGYSYQLRQVLGRTWTQFYRDLDYIMAKFMLMVIGGLLHGFTFWDVKHTVIGMQNAMFANFMAIVICAPLTNQIMARAIQSRELFEVRESKSNTFHWSTLLLSQFIVEIPYAIVFSTFYYITWYFPIQLPLQASVAGFWWFTYCIFFQLYYISLCLAIVYAAADLPMASTLLGLLFNFIISFCGVVQPPSLMPTFWKFMWRVSPFTYFVENLVGTSLHNRVVRCSAQEMNYLDPPSGETCGSYLEDYFQTHDGYVANPNATSQCGICQYSNGDEYLATVGMSDSHKWRNIGLYCVYIGFNLVCMLGMYYMFRVRGISLPEIKIPFFNKEKKPEETKEAEEVKLEGEPEPVPASEE